MPLRWYARLVYLTTNQFSLNVPEDSMIRVANALSRTATSSAKQRLVYPAMNEMKTDEWGSGYMDKLPDLLPSELRRIEQEKRFRLTVTLIILVMLTGIGWFLWDRAMNPNVALKQVAVVQGEPDAASASQIIWRYLEGKYGWSTDDLAKVQAEYHISFFQDAQSGYYFLLIDDLRSRKYKGINPQTHKRNVQVFNLYAAYAWDPKTGVVYRVPERYLDQVPEPADVIEIN